MNKCVFRHANERKVKGIEYEGLDNIAENNDEFENIPSENESDEGTTYYNIYNTVNYRYNEYQYNKKSCYNESHRSPLLKSRTYKELI